MTHRGLNAFCRTGIAVLSMTVLHLAVPLHAGDEDMSPSAYHVFDPETGFMVTVDPLAEEQLQPGIDGAERLDAAGDDRGTIAGEAAAPSQQVWLYVIAALILLTAFAIWRGRGSRSA